MRLQLDGSETLEDIHEALRELSKTIAGMPNRAMRKALRKQQDELLVAELAITQRGRRRPGDC